MEALLTGRLILIAEDEPLIALEIVQGFEDAGAGSSWPAHFPTPYVRLKTLTCRMPSWITGWVTAIVIRLRTHEGARHPVRHLQWLRS